MTPERVRELVQSAWPRTKIATLLVDTIVAACAEERRAALTEAAEACRQNPTASGIYCARIIERLRDKS